MGKGYNLPDNISPNDPEAPWNQTNELTRQNYRYETPRARRDVSLEVQEQLNDLYDNLVWLEQTDPEDDEFFGDWFGRLDDLKYLVKKYLLERLG